MDGHITTATERYGRCIESSKRVRWDIEEDVIRGRKFETSEKFLPDGLSLIEEFECLLPDEKIVVSQIQGRTYANVFGLVERFINAKILELSRDHWLGDQVALEAMIRFSDEELKHQELFRRIERMTGEVMPEGYKFVPQPDEVAGAVLGMSDWAVLALTLDIELFTQLHYRESIDPDVALSPLFKDVFLFHWKEESQHAIIDELEWRRHDAQLTDDQRSKGVSEFIQLVAAVDGILVAQAAEDARYLVEISKRPFSAEDNVDIEAAFLKAYRWQYIFSGAQHPHFAEVLGDLTTEDHRQEIGDALASF